MKSKAILFGVSAATLATPVFADTVVDICGSSAFRSATLATIRARYQAASSPSFQYAHDQAAGSLTGATLAIFKGNFPGISGTTIIRTHFTGSVEGIRALVSSPANDETYYQNIAGNFITAASASGGETNKDTAGFAKSTETANAEIAFSDVAKASTPYASNTSISAQSPGAVVFTMITNEGSPLTNITTQQFKALFKSGWQPLSLFDGVESHNPDGNSPDGNAAYVFAVGRNDGSGTRTTYLAETGLGFTNTVNQYVSVTSDSAKIDAIQLVPEGGVNDAGDLLPGATDLGDWIDGGHTVTQSSSNKSTVWGQDQPGNGGYNSGGTLKGDMGKTTADLTVFDDTGALAFQNVKGYLVSWLSIGDSADARDAGAKLCSYNGVALSDFAAAAPGTKTLTATDKAKVTEGAYTAWGFQQMYKLNALTSDQNAVYTGILNNLGANLGTAGIPKNEMHVTRGGDGGIVAP